MLPPCRNDPACRNPNLYRRVLYCLSYVPPLHPQIYDTWKKCGHFNVRKYPTVRGSVLLYIPTVDYTAHTYIYVIIFIVIISLIVENIRSRCSLLNFNQDQTGWGDWMNWVSVARFGRSWNLNPQIWMLVESNQLLKNANLTVSRQALGIIRIGQGLVGSVSGYCDWVGYHVMVLVA